MLQFIVRMNRSDIFLTDKLQLAKLMFKGLLHSLAINGVYRLINLFIVIKKNENVWTMIYYKFKALDDKDWFFLLAKLKQQLGES